VQDKINKKVKYNESSDKRNG